MTCYIGQDVSESTRRENIDFARNHLEQNGIDTYMSDMSILANSLYNTVRTIIGGGRIGYDSRDRNFLINFRDRLYAMLKVIEEDYPDFSIFNDYPDTDKAVKEAVDYLQEHDETIRSWDPSVGDLAYKKWKEGYILKTGRGKYGTLISPEGILYRATGRGIESETGQLLTNGNGKMPGWLPLAAGAGLLAFLVMR